MKASYVVALSILIVIPCSHPLKFVGAQREIGLQSGRPEGKSEDDPGYVSKLPEQPDRAARIELSLILENFSLSERINNILIRCMSSNTATNASNWGAFSVDRFTPSQVQVQYFCIVSEAESLEFPGVLDEYLSRGNLLRCLRDEEDSIPEGVDIISGRNVAAPRSGSIVSATGSTPGWAAGVALAVVVAIGFIALIGVLLKGEDQYLEEDFADFDSSILDYGDSLSCSDSRNMSSGDEREPEENTDNSDSGSDLEVISSDSEGEGRSGEITD